MFSSLIKRFWCAICNLISSFVRTCIGRKPEYHEPESILPPYEYDSCKVTFLRQLNINDRIRTYSNGIRINPDNVPCPELQSHISAVY